MRIIMNSTLTTPSRHTEQLHPEQHAQQLRRVGLVDRAALHLGVALIKWGRRPRVQTGRERRANGLERALAHTAREARIAAHRDAVLHDYALQLRVR
jgi:hypothetical protein